MNKKIKVGDRFYSKYFKNYGTVVKYVDDNNWWFKLDDKLVITMIVRYPVMKAQSLPGALQWVEIK